MIGTVSSTIAVTIPIRMTASDRMIPLRAAVDNPHSREFYAIPRISAVYRSF